MSVQDVYLVRHGPTHQSAMIGWSDVPVDLSNTHQIAQTRALLPHYGYLVTSDLQRAALTGDAIGTGLTRHPNDPNLREFHFGDWDGRHFDEIDAESPGALQAYFENPGDTAAPNGESWNTVEARVTAALAQHINAAQGQPVIIVAHMGAIMCALRPALGISAYDMMAQKISPLSVSHMQLQNGQSSVICVNRLSLTQD